MKIIKWGLVIAATFAVACVLIFTFMQDEFKATAAVKLIFTETPEFPLYLFTAATFAIGLLMGFFAAAYYYIAGQAGIHSKKKEIKRLEETVKTMETELARLREHTVAEVEEMREGIEKTLEKGTASLKAVGEKDIFA
ncbi:MAG: LapA family protein [Chitinispirillia bacterium]|nr:LapA family protein [Chitinispirillia bacterium]MCL2268442.1 LapA family protein [Chitinispirillia bacterium]